MKKFYLSKTVIVGALQILSAALLLGAEFAGKGDFSTPALLLFANGLIMIVLRFVSTEPIGL